jgi:Fe-S cluster assembly protein SufD
MSDSIVKITRSRINPAVESVNDIGFIPTFEKNRGFSDYRKQAWQDWQKIPFPSNKDEEWRRTSLKGLELSQYKQYNTDSGELTNAPEHLKTSLLEKNHGGQVLISGDSIEAYLSPDLKKKGVIFTDFKTALNENPLLVEKLLGRIIKPSAYKFGALTAAIAENGVVLYIPKNMKVEEPFQSITWAPGAGSLHTSHVIIYLEEGSEATIVHETSSPAKIALQSLHTGLFEVYVGPSAKLNFVELQSLGEQMWNITHETVKVDRDGEVDWIFGSLGSKVTKNFSNLDLVGQGATGKMSGFYFANHHQHLDHDTQQNHMAPNTTSDLLFKGALLGESRSVWQGMIYVDPSASKTDGYQANRNLVLSEKARADSIPGLEILTDDVRCTHGATVGKIDKDLTFYLQSRGIPAKEAEKLIVEGFFDPIMQRIPFEGVRKRFQQAIEEKMLDY